MQTQSSPVMVIFGAGPGLGASVARRFGQQGFRIAVVGRRPGPLERLVGALEAEGIAAASFAADLADPGQAPALIARISDHFSRIDAIEYGPASSGDQVFLPAMELDAETLQKNLNLFLLTPIEIIRAVLPMFREQGNGTILVTHGSTAAKGTPFMSEVGPAMSAMRNYLYSLHGELQGTGIYAGTLTIGALIVNEKSTDDQAFPGEASIADGFPTVDPDTLADRYWSMHTQRGGAEETYPEQPVPSLA